MLSRLLSKDNSYILRGLGITVIILHNYLISPQLGFSSCNEMSFSADKTMFFFNSLENGHIVAHYFSFLGWVGVPIFIFLTGYGTALHAAPGSKHESVIYIKRNWLKLLFLLTPILIIWGIMDFFQGSYSTLIKRAFHLTFLDNFFYPFVKCNPVSYWYFSLTFQFYLIWAFVGKYFNKTILLYMSVIFLAGLWIVCVVDIPYLLPIYRHSFAGWFFLFALGVYMAQYKVEIIDRIRTKLWLELLVVVTLLVLLPVMNINIISWLFVPFVALLCFGLLGHIVMRFKILTLIFRWVGELSACIFVCHALIKPIVNKYIAQYTNNIMLLLFIYLSFTLLLSMLYKRFYNYLMIQFVDKIIISNQQVKNKQNY